MEHADLEYACGSNTGISAGIPTVASGFEDNGLSHFKHTSPSRSEHQPFSLVQFSYNLCSVLESFYFYIIPHSSLLSSSPKELMLLSSHI